MATSIEHYPVAFRVAKTLFRTKMDQKNLVAAKKNAESPITLPVNSEISILSDFIEVLDSHEVTFHPSPYWLEGETYDPLEVFIATIEFFDRHNESLPRTVIPPEQDVKTFVNIVLQSQRKLPVSTQLEYLLDLSNGNVLGAANIGFLSSRLLARGWDTRVYPNIPISPKVILEANNHFSQFESVAHTNDAPGDTYYFWTHFFATSVYAQLGCSHSVLLNKLFEYGTPTMRFVRKYFTGQPTISNHFEASLLGRHIGIAVNELASEIRDNQSLEGIAF